METIAFKSSWKHAVLEYQIKEIDTNQDLSRSAITNRAIDAAMTYTALAYTNVVVYINYYPRHPRRMAIS